MLREPINFSNFGVDMRANSVSVDNSATTLSLTLSTHFESSRRKRPQIINEYPTPSRTKCVTHLCGYRMQTTGLLSRVTNDLAVHLISAPVPPSALKMHIQLFDWIICGHCRRGHGYTHISPTQHSIRPPGLYLFRADATANCVQTVRSNHHHPQYAR